VKLRGVSAGNLEFSKYWERS